jgi:hypothetical protein
MSLKRINKNTTRLSEHRILEVKYGVIGGTLEDLSLNCSRSSSMALIRFADQMRDLLIISSRRKKVTIDLLLQFVLRYNRRKAMIRKGRNGYGGLA